MLCLHRLTKNLFQVTRSLMRPCNRHLCVVLGCGVSSNAATCGSPRSLLKGTRNGSTISVRGSRLTGNVECAHVLMVWLATPGCAIPAWLQKCQLYPRTGASPQTPIRIHRHRQPESFWTGLLAGCTALLCRRSAHTTHAKYAPKLGQMPTPGTRKRYARDTFQRYARDTPEIRQRYARDTFQRYARDTSEIRQRYARDTPEIRFGSRDTPEIHSCEFQRYARDTVEICRISEGRFECNICDSV